MLKFETWKNLKGKQLRSPVIEPAPSAEGMARAARGAKLLDAAKPNWWMMVMPDELDLLSPAKCVLGQVFGTFRKGLDVVEFPEVPELINYGFCPKGVNFEAVDADNADLKRAWKLAADERRAAAGVR